MKKQEIKKAFKTDKVTIGNKSVKSESEQSREIRKLLYEANKGAKN